MSKTLWLSFSLKNTYRINHILYVLRWIPLLGKRLPETLYQTWGMKIFAAVLSGIGEIVSIFPGKFLYVLMLIVLPGSLYEAAAPGSVFLHIFFFLTILGAFGNVSLLRADYNMYYAVMLMRINAREYAFVRCGYAVIKIIAGFLVCALYFGTMQEVLLWQCLLIPFFVAGMKLTATARMLYRYEKTGNITEESELGCANVLLLLIAAYALPAAGIVLPGTVTGCLMIVPLMTGAASVLKMASFQDYRAVYQQLWAVSANRRYDEGRTEEELHRRGISEDAKITSRQKGLEYFNELFMKRHRKILWEQSKYMAGACVILCLFALFFSMFPPIKVHINQWILLHSVRFVWILYAINRGKSFTKALFINCDHSMLTYPFYRQPRIMLKLFRLRLWEMIKVNLPQTAVIGAGLPLVLYVSGGTENPLHYGSLFCAVISMGVLFSAHYLTMYYLFQPYDAGMEPNGTCYQLMLSATWLIGFLVGETALPIAWFGAAAVAVCLLYCILAYILVRNSHRKHSG